MARGRVLRVIAALVAVAAIARAERSPGNTGEVTGRVTVKSRGLFGGLSDKGDRSGVVVYLEGVPGEPPGPAPPPVAIRQRDKQFVPRVMAVRAGGAVSFPNDDRIFHNVFSLSKPAKFDLGLYKSGTEKRVTLDRPGQVDVFCNIHPDMVATIKVLDTGWFAVTDRDGSFRIAGVPPGTFALVAWQPHGEPFRGTVTVTAGGATEVKIEIVEGRAPLDHPRKDGTPYGRYE